MVTKQCPSCQTEKPATHFDRNASHRDGLQTLCRKCQSRAIAAYKKTEAYKKHCDNPKRRLRKNLTTQLRTSVGTHDAGGREWESRVGWKFHQLVVHLERQFTEGMTWENYGKWHLDHVIPKCSFDMPDANSPGFKQCWALDNLQPLWGWQNSAKGGKRYAQMYMDTGESYEGEYEDWVREQDAKRAVDEADLSDIPF